MCIAEYSPYIRSVVIYETEETRLKQKTTANEPTNRVTRLTPMLIINVLKRYSNEKCPLKAGEISANILKDFNLRVSSDTVKRTLADMIDNIFVYATFLKGYINEEAIYNTSKTYGFYLFVRLKNPATGEFEGFDARTDSDAAVKYYYYESIMSKSETAVLCNALDSYKDISDSEFEELKDKLCSLNGYTLDREGYKEDTDVYIVDNIRYINSAVTQNMWMEFQYCAYKYNNGKLQLTPRRNGEYYPVKPLFVTVRSNFLYLAAYNPHHDCISHFRIDKITRIKSITAEKSLPKDIREKAREYFKRNKPDITQNYGKQHPVMFAGTPETIKLLCRETESNYIFNAVKDVFGKNDIRIRKATPEEIGENLPKSYEEYRKENTIWYHITLMVSLNGAEHVIMQYSEDLVPIYPPKLKENVKAHLDSALKYYK